MSGCVTMHADMTFKDDGSVVLKKDISIPSASAQADVMTMINQWRQDDTKNGFTVENTANGYRSSKSYADMQAIADTGGDFWTPDPDYGDIRLHKGLLYDYYSIRTVIKGQENAALPQAHYENDIPNFFQVPTSVDVWSYLEYRKQADREASQLNALHNQAIAAAAGAAVLDFTIHVPMPVDGTNADTVSEDGKTLTWDLKPAFINMEGGERGRNIYMQAQFRVFHQTTAIVLGGIAAALAIAAIGCAVQAKRKQSSGRSRPYLIGLALSVVCLVALGGLVKSSLAEKVTFSNSDRIVSKALPEGQSYPDLPSPNDLGAAEKLVKDKSLHGEVQAISAENSDGFLSLISTSAGPCFIIYDKVKDTVAAVPYQSDLIYFRGQYHQYTNGKKSYDPLRFTMGRINDDRSGPDAGLGIWEGDIHKIPTYILVEADENGVIRVDGDPYSAHGTIKPPRYHSFMKDEANVRLAKIFANHIDSLSQDIRARDVILPNQ